MFVIILPLTFYLKQVRAEEIKIGYGLSKTFLNAIDISHKLFMIFVTVESVYELQCFIKAMGSLSNAIRFLSDYILVLYFGLYHWS